MSFYLSCLVWGGGTHLRGRLIPRPWALQTLLLSSSLVSPSELSLGTCSVSCPVFVPLQPLTLPLSFSLRATFGVIPYKTSCRSGVRFHHHLICCWNHPLSFFTSNIEFFIRFYLVLSPVGLVVFSSMCAAEVSTTWPFLIVSCLLLNFSLHLLGL